MLSRIVALASSLAFFMLPNVAVAQFGLGGNRRQAGGFQELQELAKQQQAGGGAGAGGLDGLAGMAGGMGDMQKMLEEALKDPQAKEYLEKMGHNFEEAMDQLSKMSPDEMKKQMEDAMASLTDTNMIDNIVGQREEVLQQLEMTKTVPPEELVKMRADPAYFELKMRESFGQIKEMFNNPEMADYMAEAMQGMTEMFSASGELFSEIEKLVSSGELSDDSKIEEARLQLLGGDFANNPLLSEMLGKEEMMHIVNDPAKFREGVKEGQRALGLGVGAGVGEL
mmetsp:Transcript_5663/g.7439  ORF Transcript_5663/g.7439 Transcript_5663/m.7439 type:complete len:282 (-) Transcript_5663:376-1221(-)|eukprot:CAMPEP_0198143506 /NCGR_PEP_ID=MMETSP1443-20131203/8072_1 /TAXON_ID=186043 /ORGANISM="Entomoneis sp., Strain CCMP2396" /LENGTH=281 /DNA_ID=CAMNT_0043806753 /DNA_START=124 /DNA_END=969 /DNA_ORIENTATION=-